MLRRLGFTELFKLDPSVLVCLWRPRRPVEATGDTRFPLSLLRCNTGIFFDYERSRGRLGGVGSLFLALVWLGPPK